MTKVYPNANAVVSHTHTHHHETLSPVQLTVWKKSLVFNCYGFTVFDSNGNLLFRLDNYSNPQILHLMDASGHSLLTIRRKRLSLLDWVVYQGETAVNPPLFTVTKHVNLLNTKKSLAHVTTANRTIYQIEGSYTQRNCVVYDEKRRRILAEIKRKEAAVGGVAFGGDVFRLFLHQMDAAAAMAIVIILDQMFL
ncbi:hypothetical protein L6452_41815 [Arctium lappa]|uniref:Uncharacterized protein n=1 Tax=Arctium lappa TaxID=4217 RepID=A0ACB8XFY6_ARCLA|nr:hypothetical protein L6452_41815 [Arctium lappa]